MPGNRGRQRSSLPPSVLWTACTHCSQGSRGYHIPSDLGACLSGGGHAGVPGKARRLHRVFCDCCVSFISVKERTLGCHVQAEVQVCEGAKLFSGTGTSEENIEHLLLSGRGSAECSTAQVHTPPGMPQACPTH